MLQPLIEKAAQIIVEHADLLESSHMELLLLQLVAHVSTYRVILKRCAVCACNFSHNIQQYIIFAHPLMIHVFAMAPPGIGYLSLPTTSMQCALDLGPRLHWLWLRWQGRSIKLPM